MESRGSILQRFYDQYSDFLKQVLTTTELSFTKHNSAKSNNEITINVNSLLSSMKGVSFQLIEKNLPLILKQSEQWELPLSRVYIDKNLLCVKIKNSPAFQLVLSEILAPEFSYGTVPSLNLPVRVRSFPSQNTLTEYRLTLLANIARNILRTVGYDVVAENEPSSDSEIVIGYSTVTSKDCRIQCGHVVNPDGTNSQLSVDEYVRLREEDMKAISENKYWDSQDNGVISRVARAAVIMELVQTKFTSPVKINADQNRPQATRERSSRGAPFILYNLARISEVVRKFEAGQVAGAYPALPPIMEVDWSALKEPEEWHLLFDYLLEYPSLLQRVTMYVEKEEIHQHLLCNFLFNLAQTFSVYYRRHRFLQEAKPHLVPTIVSRIYLIKAVRCILLHGLKLLTIEPVEYM